MAIPSTYSAPWSTTLKATTAFVVLLLVGLAIAVQFSVPQLGQMRLKNGAPFPLTPAMGGLIGVAIPALILGVTALFAVRGFELTRDELLVYRLLWNTRIPLEGLSDAFADPRALEGSIRLFGVGGLFCSCGLFRNKRFGTYKLYATDATHAVVLLIGSKTFVVTPGDTEKFVKCVKSE